MGNFQIAKKSTGLYFKTWPENVSDMPFPKEIQTAAQMREFFRKGLHTNQPGSWPEPTITFRDPSYKSIVKYYHVRKDRKLAMVDFDKTISFNFNPEAYEFLRQYSSDADIEQSEKRVMFEDKIKFLKSKVSDETLNELETLLASKNSDAGITEACKAHAKKFYDLDNVIVEFEE